MHNDNNFIDIKWKLIGRHGDLLTLHDDEILKRLSDNDTCIIIAYHFNNEDALRIIDCIKNGNLKEIILHLTKDNYLKKLINAVPFITMAKVDPNIQEGAVKYLETIYTYPLLKTDVSPSVESLRISDPHIPDRRQT